MHRTSRCAAVAAVIVWSLLPSASVFADTHVVIRTYDMTAMPSADRNTALAVAAAVLEGAGLEVSWLACETATATVSSHPCLSALDANELAVRLVRLPRMPGSAGQVTLGYSLVETEARSGSLATVYVDRVTTLAGAAAIDVPTLLGRAIAHEVGHLLLGTSVHARTGVMRAVWSPAMLRHDRPDEWLFTPHDAQALRAAVQARTAGHVASW